MPLSSLLSGEDASLRAAMALSILMGSTVMRTIMNLDVLQAGSTDAFKRRLEQLLRIALADHTADM